MPVYRVRKSNLTQQAHTFQGGAAPDTAGIGVDTSSTVNAVRTGGAGLLRFSADGSTLQTAVDGTYGFKAVTSGTPVSLFTVPCAASGMIGGEIHYEVDVTDGTDFQVATGMVSYSVVNKAGAFTATITHVTGSPVKALSTGTLAPAFTITTGSSTATIKVDPTTSLTPTTQRITFVVIPYAGAVTLV